ncbi:hypothetical protein FACS1894199_07400 [Bacteroidia bacterium]|nr:hypothetical protein FACS1894199_07400 [Bacteroidia bacterium]
MVFYSNIARYDLQNIYDGLLKWQTENGQLYMDYVAVVNYHNKLLDVCDAVGNLSSHALAKYSDHKRYGVYVYTYKRHKRTCWYIIYDRLGENILIQKIMNNYQTIA